MKGRNHLYLCGAEMMDILQTYVDAKFKSSPGRVTTVQQKESVFVVAIEEASEEDETQD